MNPHILDRLLLSKSFLDRIRFQPIAMHDRHTLAANIIASHDAAELAIAAVADHLGCSTPNPKTFLLDYFEPIKIKTSNDVHGRDYCRQLNTVRNQLKHNGIFPDQKQWARVAENTYQTVAKWCDDYLGLSFSQLDESSLITDEDVRKLISQAKDHKEQEQFKEAMEKIGIALAIVFKQNAALRNLKAGNANSDDAIRLLGFGVHANDFLALQEFLPSIETTDKGMVPKWTQSNFGHPGNWRPKTVEFCLRTFVDVAIKIQDAKWIPGALSRDLIYTYQIEAIKDGVQIWTYVVRDMDGNEIPGFYGVALASGAKERLVVKTLNKGETLTGFVTQQTESEATFYGEIKRRARTLNIVTREGTEKPVFAHVSADEVRVWCVPRDDEWVKSYLPNLPIIEWEPE